MATYMIDYENVKTGGLNGISRLTEADRVIIFYSENANRLTFDLHRRLMECKADIEYREVTVGGHNALDFQLVTYLGYLIAQDKCGQYLIISNDRGFEYVVNFWRRDGLSIGLLPYLKDPAYALQKVARIKEECICEDAETAEEVSAAEDVPAVEECAAAIPDADESEPAITVEFYSVEEAAPAEEAVPATEPVPADECAPVEESTPAEETVAVPVAEPKQTRRAPRKKTAPKKEETPAEAPKKEEKAARKLPSMDELRELVGDLVEDDPELRFVSTAITKYKTKLGLNNALVKSFGNQKAGEIYQKVKQFVK